MARRPDLVRVPRSNQRGAVVVVAAVAVAAAAAGVDRGSRPSVSTAIGPGTAPATASAAAKPGATSRSWSVQRRASSGSQAVRTSRAGMAGSVVTLICDGGERYLNSYYDPHWLHERGHDLEPYLAQLEHFYRHGDWRDDLMSIPMPAGEKKWFNGSSGD